MCVPAQEATGEREDAGPATSCSACQSPVTGACSRLPRSADPQRGVLMRFFYWFFLMFFSASGKMTIFAFCRLPFCY